MRNKEMDNNKSIAGKYYNISLDPDVNTYLQEVIYFRLNPIRRTTKTSYIEYLIEKEMQGESIIRDFRVNLNEKGKPIVKRHDGKKFLSIRLSKEMNDYVVQVAFENRISVTQYINVLLRADMNIFLAENTGGSVTHTDIQKIILGRINRAVEQADIQ